MARSEMVRAVVLTKPRTLEAREFPRPVIGADGALLRIEACGICGSDYEQYEGAQPPHEDYTPYPVIPGHEPLGIIEEIGRYAATRWGVSEGDRVAVRSGYGCGQCEACRRWEPRACPKRGGTYGYTDVGKAPHLWGGYAERMYLSPYSVMKKMDPTLPAGVAVMFNPRAAGRSWAGSVPGTGPRDRVVILGAGQRGLCCVIAARAAGAKQIVITGLGRDAEKLALARELGADAAIDVEKDDVVTSVRDATGRRRRGRRGHHALRAAVAESRRGHRRPEGAHRRRRAEGAAPRPGLRRGRGDLQGADDSWRAQHAGGRDVPRDRHHRVRPLPVRDDAHGFAAARAGRGRDPHAGRPRARRESRPSRDLSWWGAPKWPPTPPNARRALAKPWHASNLTQGAQPLGGQQRQRVNRHHRAAERHRETRVHRRRQRAADQAAERQQVPAERVDAQHPAAQAVGDVRLQERADLRQVERVREPDEHQHRQRHRHARRGRERDEREA